MRPSTRSAGRVPAVLTLIALALAGWATAAEPDRLAGARDATQKAAAAEKAAHTEWNAREMARSATREIGVAARATVERALQNVLAARQAVKDKQGAGKDALAAAERQLAERLTTLRSAADKMFNDQRVAQQATDDLRVIEETLGEKMRATRCAERAVVALEAASAGNAAADKADAARALCEADLVSALEARAWVGVQRSTLQQMAAGNAQAAEIGTKLAAADPDPARQKLYREFAAKMAATRDAEEKTAAEQLRTMQASDAKIDALRAAALAGLKPLAAGAWDCDKARHLLVRAGFGGTPDEVAKLHAMGLYKAVDYLVDFHRRPAANAPFDAHPPTTPDLIVGRFRNDFVRRQVAGGREANDGAQAGRLRLWWVKRLVESPRPLQEKLTLFWHGHFATQYSVVRHSYAFYLQNQLFREQAAGNFGALLYGIVHDPVMIRYLDNNTNVKGHANENLAREIMELFAMGVDQGYTEKDIREAARALTGYTYDAASGQFRYLADKHDDGLKTVFGKTGNWTGDDVVRLILEQPATARFVAGKLFRYFAHDDPSPATVDTLAAVLRRHHYDLAPLLKNLFLSEEFYGDRARDTQIKNPVQLVVGVYRDLGVKDIANYGPVDAALRNMGQELLEPPDVKGWREGRAWINANRLFVRYNAVADLLRTIPRTQGRYGVDLIGFVQHGSCQTAPQVVDYLARACFVRPLDPQKRLELAEHLGELPPPAQWATQRDALNARLQDLLVLMLCLPEYQLT